ncbi:MAG: pseudaminic acid synthase [Vicinamibacteria bacterium]
MRRSVSEVKISGRVIGPGHPTYIVAELSANHNQSLAEAIELVKLAKEAGADAVKLQTYRPDTITIDCDTEYFRIKGTPWAGRTLYELYAEACTPWDWHPRLNELADQLDLHLFSSPFDHSAVRFLEKMNVPAYKVASFENIDLPLLRCVAKTGKPVILSTGMATLAEIDEAVRTIREAGGKEVALLKCVSAYPALPEEMNLRTIQSLAEVFGVPAGLSDHTLGISVPVAAVALGASIIEKHFTKTRAVSGPDSAFSLEPQEFRAMVDAIRTAEKAIGEVTYGVSAREKESRALRRSLFVVRNMAAGEVFNEDNVRSIRPGHGLHPRYLEKVLGRRATRDVARGTPLDWELVGTTEEP